MDNWLENKKLPYHFIVSMRSCASGRSCFTDPESETGLGASRRDGGTGREDYRSTETGSI